MFDCLGNRCVLHYFNVGESMGKLTFITGGARSGKSHYAEKLAKESGEIVTYIATAIPFDEGMKARIKHHREQRPQEWETIEQYKNFSEIQNNQSFMKADVILLDCITIMVTNNMMDYDVDYDNCSMAVVEQVEAKIKKEIIELLKVCQNKKLIIVSNELGMGLVPAYKMGNYFRDIAGRMNQYIAAQADDAYFTVSGIPIALKTLRTDI